MIRKLKDVHIKEVCLTLYPMFFTSGRQGVGKKERKRERGEGGGIFCFFPLAIFFPSEFATSFLLRYIIK